MFRKLIFNGKEMDLYYHKTSGGAEYLTDKFIECPNGEKEGTFANTNIVLRIDGDELEISTSLFNTRG